MGRGPRALVIVAQSCWHVEEEWLCLTQPGMGGSRGIGGVGREPRALVMVAQSCWHVEEEWLCLTQPGMGGPGV